jgi:anti-sigma B factor antagonist
MKYRAEYVENILFLSLDGDLIVDDIALNLLDVVNDALNDKKLFCGIDITNVRYMNSSGIGLMITILSKYRNKGGELCLINPSEHVEKLLAITKLNSIFNIVQTKAEALIKLKA